ncbi:hypothetical protein MHBO_002525 [Bonamia ostreae]|uniref:Uncharacterized protein n=1 Tax=Bonamia ostreae TaxID=126728 RepID=A0ABV2AMP1_9EUKA
MSYFQTIFIISAFSQFKNVCIDKVPIEVDFVGMYEGSDIYECVGDYEMVVDSEAYTYFAPTNPDCKVVDGEIVYADVSCKKHARRMCYTNTIKEGIYFPNKNLIRKYPHGFNTTAYCYRNNETTLFACFDGVWQLQFGEIDEFCNQELQGIYY